MNEMNREMRRMSEREERLAKKADRNIGKYNSEKVSRFKRISNYMGEVRTELKRVNWPSTQILSTFTIVTIVTIITMTLLIFGMDFGFKNTLISMLSLGEWFMSEDTVVEELENEEVEQEHEAPLHPYDLPGEWFVLNAQSGHEKKVQTNILTRIKNLHLEDNVYEVVIPTDEVVEIRNGKKVNIEKKTFPGYVLVRMDLDDTTWYEIRNTPSVIGFVGSGKVPISLSKREVERILGTNEEVEVKKESPKFKPDFEVGETVRVTTGPFADFNGIIEEINLDQSKVTVLVNIFGRETPVELGFTDIVKN